MSDPVTDGGVETDIWLCESFTDAINPFSSACRADPAQLLGVTSGMANSAGELLNNRDDKIQAQIDGALPKNGR